MPPCGAAHVFSTLPRCLENAADFHKAAEDWPTASQNMTYADQTGTIAPLLREQPRGWFARPWANEIADDLLPLWLRGEGVPIAWTEEEVQQATIHTLQLNPL